MTDATSPLPQYMTVAEVAEDLRVARSTVYEWIAAGELPALQLGRRTYRIYRKDYLAYRDQRHQEAHERADAAGRPAPAVVIPGQTSIATDGLAAL